MHADVFILHHQPSGLRQGRGRVQVLRQIDGGRRQPRAQFLFGSVARDRQALHRTDIDAGVAFNALRRHEHRLHVAVQTALHFARGLFRIEAQLHLDAEFLKTLHQVDVPHLLALGWIVIVVVAPLAEAHLLAD